MSERDRARAAESGARRALEALAAGDLRAALVASRQARADLRGDVRARVLPLLDRLEARSSPHPPKPGAADGPPSPAWAAAWAGDLGRARTLAETLEVRDRDGLLGAIDALERRPVRALAQLDRAIAAGGPEVLKLHRARALLQLHRPRDAQAALQSVSGVSFARRLLSLLVEAESTGPALWSKRGRRALQRSHITHDAIGRCELPFVLGDGAVDYAFSSRRALADTLEGLLDRMAGNLGPSPTVAELLPDGSRRFVRLELPPNPRAEALGGLESLLWFGGERALATLEALVGREPRSVYARNYLGEVLLWLGRYREAERHFVTALGIERARWTEIGMVAVYLFTGRLWRARAVANYTGATRSELTGGTLPAYRGALHRRLGDLDAAIIDLDRAVRERPTRVGSRLDLALALDDAGRREDARAQIGVLTREAAPLLAEAADAIGAEWTRDPDVLGSRRVLAAALEAMQGNRSSSFVTWVDREGRLRVLESPRVLAGDARRVLERLG